MQAVLGLVTDRDGKRNFLVEGPTGRLSIPPRAVRYVLPGGAAYNSQQRQRLEQSCCAPSSEVCVSLLSIRNSFLLLYRLMHHYKY
jgi:hypothetical protein